MQSEPPPIPSQHGWAELRFTDVVQLAGGKQSLVFSAQSADVAVAVKLTDASLVRLDLVERRTQFVAELALVDDSVVAPVKVSGQLVHRFGDWFVTATTFIDGETLDTDTPEDAELMGASLAGLHHSMRSVATSSLPELDALRTVVATGPLDLGQYQPLHGDYNSANLRRTPSGVRIFDFDDCGSGPIEFELANALYMVLFDSVVNGASTADYDHFRTPFLAGYCSRAGSVPADTTLDFLIDLRVQALDYWIRNPSQAPIGIRTSSQEWIEQLRQFVQTWSRLTGQ